MPLFQDYIIWGHYIFSYICNMKKVIRNILKGASLTGALFVFQACYGTPPSENIPVPDEVSVTTEADAAEEPAAELSETPDLQTNN